MVDEKYVNERLLDAYQHLVLSYSRLRLYYTKGVINKIIMLCHGYNKDDNLIDILIYSEDVNLYNNMLRDIKNKELDSGSIT